MELRQISSFESREVGSKNEIFSYFRVYNSFLRNAFLKMLAYRLRYYTGIVTYLMFVSVHYFIWKAVFSGKAEGELINGFTLPEMVTYITVGWICRSLYFSNIDEELNRIVRSGEIGVYLIRPVNLQLMMFCQAVGESVFRLLFFTAPIGVVLVLFFPVTLPGSWFDFFCFLLSTLSSFLILVSLNFLVGLLTFVLHSIEGISRAKYYLVQLCSGLLLPLTFFPDWFQRTLDFLPFKIIAYVPLQFYLGKVPPEQVLSVFLNQLVWIGVLFFLGQFFWQRAFSRLIVQGG